MEGQVQLSFTLSFVWVHISVLLVCHEFAILENCCWCCQKLALITGDYFIVFLELTAQCTNAPTVIMHTALPPYHLVRAPLFMMQIFSLCVLENSRTDLNHLLNVIPVRNMRTSLKIIKVSQLSVNSSCCFSVVLHRQMFKPFVAFVEEICCPLAVIQEVLCCSRSIMLI